jgi:hypothetical protein
MTEEEERIHDLLEMGMIERAIGPGGEPRYRLTEEGRDWRHRAVLVGPCSRCGCPDAPFVGDAVPDVPFFCDVCNDEMMSLGLRTPTRHH